MKKIIALFAVLVICVFYVSSAVQVFAAKDTDSLTIIDLISLRKHLIADLGYDAALDYNADNRVDAEDLIGLKRILLGLPDDSVEPDDDDFDLEFDDDGYYKDVVKP